MKIFFTLLILLSIVGICNAEIIVLYDSNTLEVKSVSSKDNAVQEEGWKKEVLQGKLKDYGLTKHFQYYKFIDGNFVQDNEKISEEINKNKKNDNVSKELKKVQSRILQDACELIESEEGKFKDIKCSEL